MSSQEPAEQLHLTKEWFDRSSRCLTEEDSNYRPEAKAMSVAQQVAHVAQTVDWFIEGAFRPEGFGMDFEAAAKEIMKVKSLAEARAWADRSFAAAAEVLGSKSEEELMVLLPEGPIKGGMPRIAIVGAIQDHTAHHRGALTVYSRMCGHTAAMPYMEM
ncbi:MAG: DinB family protein [Thermoanaerobaculia bacterium]